MFDKVAREKQRWLEKVAQQSYLKDTIPGNFLKEFISSDLVTVRRGLVRITVRGQIAVYRRRFGVVPVSGIVTYAEELPRERKLVDKFVKWIWDIDSK